MEGSEEKRGENKKKNNAARRRIINSVHQPSSQVVPNIIIGTHLHTEMPW